MSSSVSFDPFPSVRILSKNEVGGSCLLSIPSSWISYRSVNVILVFFFKTIIGKLVSLSP